MASAVPAPANAVGYLRAPISTLRESLDNTGAGRISCHDLLEAYATLSDRLRVIINTVGDDMRSVPALGHVSEHAASLVRCFRRDVQHGLQDPLVQTNEHISISAESLTMPGQREVDCARLGRDAASLAHSALRVVSQIFRFRTLSSLFTVDDLCSLLDDVLQILSTDCDTACNHLKTLVLSAWTLSNVRLPDSCVQRRTLQIVTTLELLLQASTPEECVIDSLEAIHNFLTVYPLAFFEPLVPLFPRVLDLLTSPSSAVGKQAAHALSGYALAYLTREPQLPKQAKETIRGFIRDRVQAARHAANPATPGSTLAETLSSAFSLAEPTPTARTAVWAIIILASFVILCDSDIFTQPHTLKFVAQSLILALKKKRTSMYVLHGCVWRCFVWAYMHLPRPDRSAPVVRRRYAGAARPDVRRQVFQFVKQEHRRGLGIAFAACLVQPYRLPGSPVIQSDVAEALELVREMVSDEHLDAELEGVAVLTQLVSTIGAPGGETAMQEDQLERKLVAKELFDGTLMQAQWKDLPRVLSAVEVVQRDDIRRLTEAEVLDHWEDILEIWTSCVHKSLMRSLQLTRDLSHVWQALLLVQAQLTQECGHLTSPPDFCKRAVEIVDSFLLWKLDVPSQAPVGSSQQAQLTIVGQLWRVMKNVFGLTWLQSTASSLLVRVLRREFDIDNNDVKAVWSALCADLIAASSPDLIGRLLIENEVQRVTEMTRHLWNLAAPQWTASDPPASWQDSVSFLLVPLTVWPMSQDEESLWDDILCYAILQGACVSTSSLTIIEALITRAKQQSKSLPTCPEVIVRMMLRMCPTVTEPGSPELLSSLNEYLCALYACRPDHLRVALQTLRALTIVVKRTAPEHRGRLIAALAQGMSKWVRDDESKLLQQEYNSSVMTFYSETMTLLGQHPLTMEDIAPLSEFLEAAFVRIVPPAYGPVAFKQFWESVYPALQGQLGLLPEAVKNCIRACSAALGLALPAELVSEAENRSESSHQHSSANSTPSRRHAAPSSPAIAISPRLIRSAYTSRVAGTSRHRQFETPLSSNHINTRTSARRAAPSPCPISPEILFTSDLELPSSPTPTHARRPHMSPAVPSPSPPSPTPAKRTAALPPERRDDSRAAKRVRTVNDVSDRENFTSAAGSAITSMGLPPSSKDEHNTGASSPGCGASRNSMAAPVVEQGQDDTPPAAPTPSSNDTGDSHASDDRDEDVSDHLTVAPEDEDLPADEPAPSTPAADDYESWERVVSTAEARRVQQELGIEPEHMDEVKEELSSPTPGPRNSTPAFQRDDTAVVTSPAGPALAPAGPSHLPLRSQTFPALGAPPLPSGPASAPLATLAQVRDGLARGRTQMPVEALLAGLRMLHEMNGLLNEELGQRLGGAKSGQ